MDIETETESQNNGDIVVDTATVDISLEPARDLAYFTNNTLLELSNTSWSPNCIAYRDIQPYLRGCKWSPDGTCCLCIVNNDGQHLLELSHDLYGDANSVKSDRPVDILNSVVHIKESGLVYDFAWFPCMDSSLSDTCCWLTTKQHAPIQLWDAFDGALRCSYRGFNHVDELEPAISATFSFDGFKIYGGYKKNIKIFDTDRPGRDCSSHPTKSQSSCLLATNKLLFVGYWNTRINMYSVNELGNLKSAGNIYGHSGGVTHLKITPDGTKLISGARKDNQLIIWDLRHFRKPLKTFKRPVETNQRIYFDLTPDGRYLISGASDGILRVWDLQEKIFHESEEPSFMFPVHKDCCNSVSAHPSKAILATGSGQFHHDLSCLAEDCDVVSEQTDKSDKENISIVPQTVSQRVNSSSSSDDSDTPNAAISSCVRNKFSDDIDNSLTFWWIGEVL